MVYCPNVDQHDGRKLAAICGPDNSVGLCVSGAGFLVGAYGTDSSFVHGLPADTEDFQGLDGSGSSFDSGPDEGSDDLGSQAQGTSTQLKDLQHGGAEHSLQKR